MQQLSNKSLAYLMGKHEWLPIQKTVQPYWIIVTLIRKHESKLLQSKMHTILCACSKKFHMKRFVGLETLHIMHFLFQNLLSTMLFSHGALIITMWLALSCIIYRHTQTLLQYRSYSKQPHCTSNTSVRETNAVLYTYIEELTSNPFSVCVACCDRYACALHSPSGLLLSKPGIRF